MTVSELQQCIADYLYTGGSGADPAFVRVISHDDALTAVTFQFKQVTGASKTTAQTLDHSSGGGSASCFTVDVEG